MSYGAPAPEGSWREYYLNEVRDQIDLDRVHFLGKIPYADYVRLLQRSDAHVYLTYPFVASWSLRESLAIGCAVVGSDTEAVTEFVTHGENGLITPCLDPAKLADTVLELLENRDLSQALRQAAVAYAKTHLPMKKHLKAFYKLIDEAVG